MGTKGPVGPALRKETKEWFATHTIPDVREIAEDLENAGEDVGELLKALDDLERYAAATGTRSKARA